MDGTEVSVAPKPIRASRRSSTLSNPDKDPKKDTTTAEPPQIIQTSQTFESKGQSTVVAAAATADLSATTQQAGTAGSERLRKRKLSSTSTGSVESHSERTGSASSTGRGRSRSRGRAKRTSTSKDSQTRCGIAASLRSNSQASLVEGLPYYSDTRSRSRSRSKSTEKGQQETGTLADLNRASGSGGSESCEASAHNSAHKKLSHRTRQQVQTAAEASTSSGSLSASGGKHASKGGRSPAEASSRRKKSRGKSESDQPESASQEVATPRASSSQSKHKGAGSGSSSGHKSKKGQQASSATDPESLRRSKRIKTTGSCASTR